MTQIVGSPVQRRLLPDLRWASRAQSAHARSAALEVLLSFAPRASYAERAYDRRAVHYPSVSLALRTPRQLAIEGALASGREPAPIDL